MDIVLHAHDECQGVIPAGKIIRRIRVAHGRGVVFLAGVQTNQIPRAIERAREFRRFGIQVVIGGFHVSGCFAMPPEPPDDIKTLQDLGVICLTGEAEWRVACLLQDAYHEALRPAYNYLDDPRCDACASQVYPERIPCSILAACGKP